MPLTKPATGTLGSDTIIGLSRGFALYNHSLPSKTRLVIPAQTGPIFSDDDVSSAAKRLTSFAPSSFLNGVYSPDLIHYFGELLVMHRDLYDCRGHLGQPCLTGPLGSPRWLAVPLAHAELPLVAVQTSPWPFARDHL